MSAGKLRASAARDEEPLAWCPGCGDRIPTEVIRERGVCSNCYGTSDDPWAAARAETTTDNALAEAWDVWDHGYRAGLRDASRGTPGESPNPYRAAARAETTTGAIARVKGGASL